MVQSGCEETQADIQGRRPQWPWWPPVR